ncbi:MAG TPA: hypothetical protein DD490_11080 [Acidobacteria bacterium]|nr:hypothetical protein [Acidobacteriota bacterium]
MSSPADPVWLLPLILLGFPLAFLSLWSFVCGLLSVLGGYRSLREYRIDRALADAGEKLPTPWYVRVGWVSYRGGILTFRASATGLTVRVLPIFLFHPPLHLPWERLQENVGALLLDSRVRLGVPAATLAAIRDAKARLGG